MPKQRRTLEKLARKLTAQLPGVCTPPGEAGGVLAAPPRVTRGVNRHELPRVGREASADALTFSGPRHKIAAVIDYLSIHARLGPPVEGGGGCFLPTSWTWGDVKLFFDPDPEGPNHFVVQMMGGGVALVSKATRIEWLIKYVLGLGCKITRLDIAIDLYGTNQRIIQRAIASCENRENVHFRTWRRTESGSNSGDIGRSVYFGQRGSKGSGRCGRLYDKGVEQGVAPAGRWIRYEVEFSDECAQSAADQFAHGGIKRAVACALGAFDFRRVARGRGQREHASRRERVGWWAEFVGSCETVLVRARKRATTIEGYAEWLRNAVMPGVVTYARVVGLSVERFLGDVSGDAVRYCERKARSQVGREFKLFFEQAVPI